MKKTYFAPRQELSLNAWTADVYARHTHLTGLIYSYMDEGAALYDAGLIIDALNIAVRIDELNAELEHIEKFLLITLN